MAAATTAGCASEAGDELAEAELAVTCPVPVIDPARSLAVTEPEVLAKFSFRRVMTAIAASANASNTPRAIYRAWMATFAACTDPKIDPNGYGIVCPRVESQLGEIDPFAASGPRFVPVALTNRFDLAPTSGADCGEYRIVFALRDSPGDRAFFIFEGRLANPRPAKGLASCAPVADLWAGLSVDPSAASRAAKLEQLYFTGLAAGDVAFSPVVAATSYGLAAEADAPRTGQIRTNGFVNGAEWQLREFQLAKPCDAGASCALAAQHVTVKVNPANELFAGTHTNAPAFQDQFVKQVGALSSPSAATIAMATGNRFNEYESVSQRQDTVYRNFETAALRTRIQAAITNPLLSVDNILDRATTQTCAGCHQLSNNVNLGDGVRWPSSLFFVHINESGTLSPALRDVFLPQRASVLRAFLEAQCNGGAATLDDGLTLSGAPLDSPN